MVPIAYYLVLAAILFSIGVAAFQGKVAGAHLGCLIGAHAGELHQTHQVRHLGQQPRQRCVHHVGGNRPHFAAALAHAFFTGAQAIHRLQGDKDAFADQFL